MASYILCLLFCLHYFFILFHILFIKVKWSSVEIELTILTSYLFLIHHLLFSLKLFPISIYSSIYLFITTKLWFFQKDILNYVSHFDAMVTKWPHVCLCTRAYLYVNFLANLSFKRIRHTLLLTFMFTNILEIEMDFFFNRTKHISFKMSFYM